MFLLKNEALLCHKSELLTILVGLLLGEKATQYLLCFLGSIVNVKTPLSKLTSSFSNFARA